MEQVAMTALQADVLKLAIAALGVLAVALVLIVYFGSRAIQGILAAQGRLLDAYQQIATSIQQLSQTFTILTNQVKAFQESHMAALAGIHGDLKAFEAANEERSKGLLDSMTMGFGSITNLMVETEGRIKEETTRIVTDSTDRMAAALKPLLETLLDVKAEVQQAKAEAHAQQIARHAEQSEQAQRYQAVLDGIDLRVGQIGQQIIDVVGMMNKEIEREKSENTAHSDGGGPAVGVDPDADMGTGRDGRDGGAAAGGDSGTTGDDKPGE